MKVKTGTDVIALYSEFGNIPFRRLRFSIGQHEFMGSDVTDARIYINEHLCSVVTRWGAARHRG